MAVKVFWLYPPTGTEGVADWFGEFENPVQHATDYVGVLEHNGYDAVLVEEAA